MTVNGVVAEEVGTDLVPCGLMSFGGVFSVGVNGSVCTQAESASPAPNEAQRPGKLLGGIWPAR